MSIDKIKTNGQEILFPHKIPHDKSDIKTENQNYQLRAIRDINDISEDLRHYFEEGININKSFSEFKKGQFNFNLSFNTQSNQTLAISGNYFLQHSKLNTNINFTFQQQVEEDGETKNKLFEFNYNLEAENIFEKRKDTKEEKEDILSFVRRISHKIYKLAEDDTIKLRSIYLDQEDMNDIVYFEDEKGRQVLMELINLIILTARLKQEENKDKEKLEADFYPERKKTEKEEETTLKVNKFNLSIDIKELSSEENEDSETTE